MKNYHPFKLNTMWNFSLLLLVRKHTDTYTQILYSEIFPHYWPEDWTGKTAKQFHCNNSKLKLYLATLSCILSKSMNIKHTAFSLNEQYCCAHCKLLAMQSNLGDFNPHPHKHYSSINSCDAQYLKEATSWIKLKIILIWKQPWYNDRLLCHKDFNVLPFHVE